MSTKPDNTTCYLFALGLIFALTSIAFYAIGVMIEDNRKLEESMRALKSPPTQVRQAR